MISAKESLGLAACASLAAALMACSTTAPPPLTYQSEKLVATRWVPKVDHFLVVVDDSLSMSATFKGQRKVDIARDVAVSFGQTAPELAYSAGLRSFGQGKCLPHEKTSLLAGMGQFSSASFVAAAGQITCPNGYSPLHLALKAAAGDLAGASKAALIVVTDGLNMGQRVIDAADELKSTFGKRLCIYVVQVGDDRHASALLSKVATGPECGGVVGADELASPSGMAAFVERALLLADSDGDGVPDDLDRCPDTPRGVAVDSHGCPPEPPAPPVEPPAAPRAVVPPPAPAPPAPPATWSFAGNVLFDTDKAEIKAAGRELLVNVADFLKANPQYTVEIQGHTDSTGSHDHNMKLSQARANSVLSFLVAQGVDAQRLSAVGFGPDQPVASNDTREGRARNRRVDLKPTVK